MNVTCHVVEDLMPLYAEQLASQDSCVLVEEHLKRCPSCRARLEVISQPAPLPLDRDTTPLEKAAVKASQKAGVDCFNISVMRFRSRRVCVVLCFFS